MAKNKKILTGAGCIVFCILLFSLLGYVSRIVERKSCINYYKPFFEEEAGFDVLFFGSSHMACDISPMDLWNDYGITSYNFGNSAEPVPVTYWTMEMALEYSDPKLVVLDTLNCTKNKKYIDDAKNSTHNSWDCFPLTITKMKAIHDLIDDTDIRFEYMFDIGKYHSRWNELTSGDFVLDPSRSKGVWAYGADADKDRLLAVDAQEQKELTDEKADLDENAAGIMYTRKIIEACKDRGIDVLMVFNPYICGKKTQMQANAVQDLADEYGIQYLNFVQMDRVVDYQVDMMDAGHTNPSGMKKVTDYIGSYITNHYGLKDHRGDEPYRSWQEDYEDFLDLKIETIQPREELTTVLELLHDKSFNCVIMVKPGSDILNADHVQNAMQNIPRGHIYENTETGLASADLKPLSKIQKAAKEHLGYKVTVDNAAGQFHEEIWEGGEDPEIPDIQIQIKDNRNGQVVADMKWNYVEKQKIKMVETKEDEP